MPDTIQHKTSREAIDAMQEQVWSIAPEGRWMVAIWVYDAYAEKLTLARTTYNFPTGEFKDAVQGLSDELMAEAGAIPAIPGPLPRAAGINLGDRNEASGNGSPPVAQADGRIAGDASGETRPSIDDNQQRPADRDSGGKGGK